MPSGRRHLHGVTFVFLGIVLASCANAAPPIGVDPSEGDPSQRFASRPGGAIDFEPADSYLSLTQEWLEVLQPSEELKDQSLIDANRTVDIKLNVAHVVSIDSLDPSKDEVLAMHSSFFPGLSWALHTGSRAFVAMGQGDGGQIVLYTLIQQPDGTFFFGGECSYQALTQPLRSQLGARTDAVLSQLVGLTGSDEILYLIDGPSTPTPTPPMVLNPNSASADLLDSLVEVSLTIYRPKDWLGPYTICTHIADGWNECIDMGLEPDLPPSIQAYVREDGKLEVWLLDSSADVTAPIEELGSLDLFTDPKDAAGGVGYDIQLAGDCMGDGTDMPIQNPSVTATERPTP
jgi:hypothetical protein